MINDGLEEPLHGLVNSTKPITLHDAIERARDLQDALPRAKETFQSKAPHSSKGKEGKAAPPKESSLKNLLTLIFRGISGKRDCVSLAKSHGYRDIDVLLEGHTI